MYYFVSPVIKFYTKFVYWLLIANFSFMCFIICMYISNQIISPVSFNASKTVPLVKALQDLQTNPDDTKTVDIFIKELSKNKTLLQQPVKKYIGKGSAAIVFETPEGNVLKLTLGNHFPMNRPVESFDVPVYEHSKSGKVHCYIEEKLYQHGLCDAFVEEVKRSIRKKGYRTFDIYDGDVFQIGFSKEGKLYLLDPECAKYKTIFHAFFDKIKRLLWKLK